MTAMKKIVINRCYGGYGLSDDAIRLYASKKGFKVYPEKAWSCWHYWMVPEDHPDRVAYREADTKRDYKVANPLYQKHVFDIYDIPRSDATLVEVVEELGDDANGNCAELRIIELEAGTLYRITEYDGMESIETKDTTDWSVA